MKAALFICALSLAAAGCHNPLESDPPYIRGVITGRDLGRVGVRESDGIVRVIEYPRTLVEEDPTAPLWAGTPKSQVSWGTETHIKFRGDGVATEADLKVGEKVSVWITGAALGSYPTQVGATRIIIEKQQ